MAPKNILFLMADELRWDYMGYMDCPGVVGLTPTFDRLAGQGAAFTNCYSPNPLCMPARNAIHTGLYTFQSGQMNNIGDWPMDLPTFAQSLQRIGYRTALSGKIHAHEGVGFDVDLAEERWRQEVRDLGFDHVWQAAGKTMAFFVDDDYTRLLADRGLLYRYREDIVARVEARERGESGWWPSILPENCYVDNVIGERAVEWLDAYDDDAPWFHMVSFCCPHPSYDAPPSAMDSVDASSLALPRETENAEGYRQMVANYVAQIHTVDRNVARILSTLEARGWLEDTLIVFTADHGEMLGDWDLGGKCYWQDASVRVPLIVRHPDCASGQLLSAPVSCHDVTATMLEFASGRDAAHELLPGCSSRSLIPLLNGEASRTRDAVYSENGGQFVPPWRMMDDAEWKYVWEMSDGSERLFHKGEDPLCLRDVMGDHRHEADRLRRAMLREHLEHPAPKRGRAAFTPGVAHRIGRERLERYNENR